MIDTPTGGQVPLGDVAELSIVLRPTRSNVKPASRRIDITCNVDGRDLGSVATEIGVCSRQCKLQTGYHPEFWASMPKLKRRAIDCCFFPCFDLLRASVILYIDFQSWKLVGVILCTLPLALLGGVLGVHASEAFCRWVRS